MPFAEMATVTGGLLPAVLLEVEGMAVTGPFAVGLGDSFGRLGSGWHIHQLRSLQGLREASVQMTTA
jgi:hypothetical protein